VWATGLGPITPPQADGTLVGLPLPGNVLAFGVEAIYWGIAFASPVYEPFNVTYAGPAPNLVAGISQINFQVGRFPSNSQIRLDLTSTLSPSFQIYVAGQ
jgi:uncharacterized protein (TIGR03437 family)